MKLAYRKYGSGQPLLILHGLFGQSDNWNTLAKRFSENNFEVYTIDQRNHGLSPHSDEWNFDAMASDIREFIDEHQLEYPVLMGHSMGGKAAMTFALNYDGILDKLIVSDIAPTQYPAHHNEVIKALQAVDFNQTKTRKEVEQILLEYIADYGTRQFLLKNIYWEDSKNERMNWRFNLSVIAQKYEEIMIEVVDKTSNVNTLFVRGEKSSYISEEDRGGIEKRFPHYKLVTVPGSGHWIHAEKPDLFYNEIMNFIR